jgi:predicted transcriptional regulator
MKQNITIALDRELIRKARILAAQKSTSISRMLSDQLTEIVNRAADYEYARKRALADLNKGLHLGGRPAAREELHER